MPLLLAIKSNIIRQRDQDNQQHSNLPNTCGSSEGYLGNKWILTDGLPKDRGTLFWADEYVQNSFGEACFQRQLRTEQERKVKINIFK